MHIHIYMYIYIFNIDIIILHYACRNNYFTIINISKNVPKSADRM